MASVQFIPQFTPADLEKVPPHLQREGEKIRMVYMAFGNLVPQLLAHLHCKLSVPYGQFVTRELADLMTQAHGDMQALDAEGGADAKMRWFYASFSLVLDAVYMGHWKTEEAYAVLTQGKTAEFADYLAQAGVYFGRLEMVWDLCRAGVFERIGSLQSGLAGSALGGARSAATRKQQARVPTPDKLRLERQKLIDAGKLPRDTTALLARKYHCTADHIRKVLKRD